jgi:sulfur carrier protein
MNIEVRLFATLRAGRFKTQTLEFRPGSTLDDVLRALSMAPGDVSLRMVNGRQAQASQELRDGDVLALFPPMGGG